MEHLYLHMAIIGCTPKGRFTEQHDVFFGIGANMKDLIPQMINFWPEAKGKIHIDAWRRVTNVNGHAITIVPANGITEASPENATKLFFLNLGGYKPGEFEEYHYKMLIAAPGAAEAILESKQTAFYKHYGFKGATSHIDDKYGIDVDDMHVVKDILDPVYKQQYALSVSQKKRVTCQKMSCTLVTLNWISCRFHQGYNSSPGIIILMISQSMSACTI